MLCCAVLCCAVLCCAVLCCAALYLGFTICTTALSLLFHSVICRFETSQWGQQAFSSSSLQKPQFDYRLYAVTDPACNARCQRSNAEAVRQAIQGGVTLVQLREKEAEGGKFIRQAQQLLEVTKSTGVRPYLQAIVFLLDWCMPMAFWTSVRHGLLPQFSQLCCVSAVLCEPNRRTFACAFRQIVCSSRAAMKSQTSQGCSLVVMTSVMS